MKDTILATREEILELLEEGTINSLFE